jgi:hypothetical protein
MTKTIILAALLLAALWGCDWRATRIIERFFGRGVDD